MAIGNIQCADSLSYPMPIIGPTTVGPSEKIFKIKVARRLEDVIFQMQ